MKSFCYLFFVIMIWWFAFCDTVKVSSCDKFSSLLLRLSKSCLLKCKTMEVAITKIIKSASPIIMLHFINFFFLSSFIKTIVANSIKNFNYNLWFFFVLATIIIKNFNTWLLNTLCKIQAIINTATTNTLNWP